MRGFDDFSAFDYNAFMSKIASAKAVRISPAAFAALDEAIQGIGLTDDIPEHVARQKIADLFKKTRSSKTTSKDPLLSAKLA